MTVGDTRNVTFRLPAADVTQPTGVDVLAFVETPGVQLSRVGHQSVHTVIRSTAWAYFG